MRVKSYLIGLVILCVLLFSGCSRMQLENMNILTTYFIKKEEKGIVVGGGVSNVRTLSDSMADKPVSLIYGEGETLSSAEERLEKSADHPLFFGGIRAVVINERYAKDGIFEFIRGLEKDYKLRSESMVFITKSDPEKIITHKAINDFTGGFAAESLLKALNDEGKISYVTLSDLFEMMAVKKAGIAVSVVETNDDILSFEGYALFDKEGKMIGFSSDEVSKGITLFLNAAAKTEFYKDGYKYEIKKTKQKLNIKKENGKTVLYAVMEFDSGGAEDKIKRFSEEEILNAIKKAFEKAQEENCDFLNLYRIYQKKYRYEFEKDGYGGPLKDWELKVQITVK